MYSIVADKFSTGYSQILELILRNPDFQSAPRGKKIKECLNVSLTVTNPLNNFFRCDDRITKSVIRYLAGELHWYFTGSNLLKNIKSYSMFWEKLTTCEFVNSAYGYIIFKELNSSNKTEWMWAYESLINDMHSRQAILRFNKSDQSYNSNIDFPCTMSGIFTIRDNMLFFNIYMRSQDEVFGRIYDFPFWSLLHQQMYNHLLWKYPNLTLGSITQINLSSHIYEKDFNLVEKMLNTGITSDVLPKLKNDLITANGKSLIYDNNDDELSSWIMNNLS